jgi:hypothetical protein
MEKFLVAHEVLRRAFAEHVRTSNLLSNSPLGAHREEYNLALAVYTRALEARTDAANAWEGYRAWTIAREELEK